MISIIICSANEVYLNNLKINIKDSIGVPYEIISFNNSNGEKGICEVYNKGIEQAQFDILCFLHEDIIIHTNNWGEVLLKIFQDPKIGLVGLAGSTYKTLTPSPYFFIGDADLQLNYCNVQQQYKFDKKEGVHDYFNPTNERLVNVTCVDGVWLCARKAALNTYRFDEELLKGFHGYDMDLSFGIIQNYEIAVTFDILITHFSEGNFDKKWLKEILLVHKKWSHILPLNLAGLSRSRILLIEKRSFRDLFNKMKAWDFSVYDMLKVLFYTNKSSLKFPKLKFKIFLSALGQSFK